MKKIIVVACSFLALSSFAAFSAPSEIIIIRHGDKLPKGESGPFLAPKGQLRAEKFASYYLSHFPKPDFIFAAKPGDLKGTDQTRSMRPLQTVAPLANQMCELTHTYFSVSIPYFDKEYPQLAHDLLTDPTYTGKTILISWQHQNINAMAKDLGVTQTLEKWPGSVYDTVYVLKYNTQGQLASFQELKNQYPVDSNPTWQTLMSR